MVVPAHLPDMRDRAVSMDTAHQQVRAVATARVYLAEHGYFFVSDLTATRVADLGWVVTGPHVLDRLGIAVDDDGYVHTFDTTGTTADVVLSAARSAGPPRTCQA